MGKTFRHGGYEGGEAKFVTEAENQRLRRQASRTNWDGSGSTYTLSPFGKPPVWDGRKGQWVASNKKAVR